MAVSLLRNTIRVCSLSSIKNLYLNEKYFGKRLIMTTRPRVEKVFEELQKNPYFDKYAQKLAKLQETSPEEFLGRVENEEKKRQEKREQRERERNMYKSQAKPQLDCGGQTQEARLERIMKVEMIQDKTKDEIIDIWNEYHKQKDCICGAMSPEQFDKIFQRGKQYPTFLLSLPREQGYEFIMCQFHGTEIHMTPLLWYQTHKENAPECLTMRHYMELRDSKNVILMRGEFDKKFLAVHEAQCLANELQLYYSTDNPQRLQLLETFTNKPDEFKHMDLIAQLETITFDVGKK